jgi:serine/threonine-protein kinase RsbW
MSLFSFFAQRNQPPAPTPAEPARGEPPAEGPKPMNPGGTVQGAIESSANNTEAERSEFSWARSIPSRTEAGREVIDEVLRQLEALCWNDRDRFGVRLALEEAVINAMKHGNHFDETKSVAIVCRMTPELLHIEIADEGQGFVPEEVPDPTDPENLDKPSGRGIVLIRNFMSRVAYIDQGTRVVMEKQRAAEVRRDDRH